jgi:hypothetical protein
MHFGAPAEPILIARTVAVEKTHKPRLRSSETAHYEAVSPKRVAGIGQLALGVVDAGERLIKEWRNFNLLNRWGRRGAFLRASFRRKQQCENRSMYHRIISNDELDRTGNTSAR